jgi:D-alanyl-D-alanine carboxypeptidase
VRSSSLLLVLAACRPHPTTGAPAGDELARGIDALAARNDFSGVILVGRGDTLRYSRGHGEGLALTDRWRWASITKQMTAVLVMQEVAKGTIDLEAPVATYLPDFASANAQVTVEQLLRHQSGLPNPDDGSPGVPPLYQPETALDPMGFCAGPVTGPPGGPWSYNNCDYTVAGAILERVTGKPYAQLFAERIAQPTNTHATISAFADVVGYAEGKPEPAYAYLRFGAAGALVGTITDLWAIDRALMSGQLLEPSARETMWDGRAEQGFMALGQWVYEVPIAGCEAPIELVERRGAIGGIAVRNFMVPAQGLVVLAMSNHAELEFGELWSGSGFAFDLLTLAAECPAALSAAPRSRAPS